MFTASGRARLAYECLGAAGGAQGESTYEREDGWSGVRDAVAVLDAAGFERPVVDAPG